jgi:hypothetical protein
MDESRNYLDELDVNISKELTKNWKSRQIKVLQKMEDKLDPDKIIVNEPFEGDLEVDNINHPPHYTQYNTEVIDMMYAIWGKTLLIAHCEMCAFKYRMRIGLKDTIDENLAKEKWYLDKANELRLIE